MRGLLVMALAVLLALPCAASAQRGWASRLTGPRARAELTHPDRDVRLRAARVLGRFGEPRRSVAALLDALEEEGDLQVRGVLMEALARRGDEAAVPRLAGRIGEAGREDRAAALRTIGAIGGESAIRVLIEWLGAADVGDDAAEALAWIGAPAVPHLLRALRAAPAAERAARVLGRIGDARATPALVLALAEGLPSVRAAAAQALAELADERAAPALVLALSDPSGPVAEAALAALGRCGGPAFAPVVAQMADRDPSSALALGALVALDPALAAPRVRAILDDPEASRALREEVAQVVIARPAPELVSSLAALARDPEHGAAAREALARVPAGGGIEALLALSGPERAIPLALALRRHRAIAEGALIERAQRALAADGSLPGAFRSALAGDASARPRLERALAAPSPRDRASAALGLALLGDAASRPSIEQRLLAEEDPRAFRALALAARALGVGVDAARIEARLTDPETAPEALALAARALDQSGDRTRRRLRRTARRGLRAGDPRVRAGAALALGEARDRSAWRALAVLLDDEHDAVRLAAARALASLDVEASREALASRERVERDPDVRRALRAAIDGAPPPPVVLRGAEVLYVRIAAAPGVRDVVDVDVLLPDGRWLRTSALESGEILLPELPAGEAEVHVRL